MDQWFFNNSVSSMFFCQNKINFEKIAPNIFLHQSYDGFYNIASLQEEVS